MSLITEYVDQDELGGGRFRNVIAMRPVAVREAGVLRAMVQAFADGDASFPHVVERAPLRVRRANDGAGRMYPVPGRDDLYIELGPPKIQIAGVWTQVSLGTPSRVGNTLTWTRPQTLTTFTMGGHFADLRIELLGGFVPENNLVAFPVAISGLTRSGLNIQNNGITVCRLRPFQMIDAANPLAAPRAITQAFVNIGGSPHLRLTLPDLTGMVRPVIDPTLELQPDATAGADTWMRPDQPNTNFGVTAYVLVPRIAGAGVNAHGLIRFDVSSIPAGATVSLGQLQMRLNAEESTTDATIDAHRSLVQWFEGAKDAATPDGGQDGSTWNYRNHNGSVAWAGASGGGAGSDYATTATDSAVADAPGNWLTWNVTPDVAAWVAGSASNYGHFLLKDGVGNYKLLDSSDVGTAANRPKLTVTYTLPAAGQSFVRSPMWGRF